MRSLLVCAALCTTFAAVGATGCDGGDAGMDRDAFLRAADANCRERSERNAAGAEDVNRPSGAWVEDYAREVEAQRELEPPSELREPWEAYLRHSARFVAEERKVYDEEARETGEAGTASAAANRAGFLARKTARELGLRVCGDQFA